MQLDQSPLRKENTPDKANDGQKSDKRDFSREGPSVTPPQSLTESVQRM